MLALILIAYLASVLGYPVVMWVAIAGVIVKCCVFWIAVMIKTIKQIREDT